MNKFFSAAMRSTWLLPLGRLHSNPWRSLANNMMVIDVPILVPMQPRPPVLNVTNRMSGSIKLTLIEFPPCPPRCRSGLNTWGSSHILGFWPSPRRLTRIWLPIIAIKQIPHGLYIKFDLILLENPNKYIIHHHHIWMKNEHVWYYFIKKSRSKRTLNPDFFSWLGLSWLSGDHLREWAAN